MIALSLALLACAPVSFDEAQDPADAAFTSPGDDAELADTAEQWGEEIGPLLILTDFTVSDVDGDWVFEPGDTLIASVRMVNPTVHDDMAYPGLKMTTTPDFGAIGGNQWYGIFARTSYEQTFEFQVPADFAGDELSVHARVIPHFDEDAGGDAISITVPITR